MKDCMAFALPKDFPWAEYLHLYDELPSTNDAAKDLALHGAPEGTTVIARRQSAGRGRMGRQFVSPEGLGLYLSVVLRPNCPADALMHLTCAAAVAACDGVENTCGLRPQIKWTNDLVVNGKKLGGILTEMSLDSATGLVDFAVLGIGINCLHTQKDFPAQLQGIATSLAIIQNRTVTPLALAGFILPAIYEMRNRVLTEKAQLMDAYRHDCMTTDKDVALVNGDSRIYAHALRIDDDGGLVVRLTDGSEKTVTTGEISVRGMYGYL